MCRRAPGRSCTTGTAPPARNTPRLAALPSLSLGSPRGPVCLSAPHAASLPIPFFHSCFLGWAVRHGFSAFAELTWLQVAHPFGDIGAGVVSLC
jgi:hypothetical protein